MVELWQRIAGLSAAKRELTLAHGGEWSEKAEQPVLDLYPYATTSPIYVTVARSNPRPIDDAAYFIAWIDRLINAAKVNRDWNTDAEKNAVLEVLVSARKVYEQMQK